MSAVEWQPRSEDFARAEARRGEQGIARPSISYWQDAWRRLKRNPRAIISLGLVIALALFTIAGPWVWRVNPAAQDIDQISRPPGSGGSGRIVEPYTPWAGVTTETLPTSGSAIATGIRLAEPATTQSFRLVWDPAANAAGYHVYRNISSPRVGRALGLPIGVISDPHRVSFEDRFDLEAVKYWYSILAVDANGAEAEDYA